MQDAGFTCYPQLEPSQPMSEEKSSSIGTMIVVAIAAGLIGYVIGKPAPPQVQAKAPDTSEKSTELGKPAEPKEPSFVKEGLVAFYPFNGNAKDESGNGNDGFLIGATLSKDRNGKIDSAYSFDGSDRILVGDNPNLRLQKLSVNVWVKMAPDHASSGQWPTVLAKRINYHRAPYSSWGLGTGPPSSPEYWTVASEDMKSKEKISLGKWQMLTLVIEKGYRGFYVNGVMQNEKLDQDESGKDIIYSDLPLFIGFAGFHDTHWVGSIDDIRIYNRALSAKAVKALYDLEKPKGK